MKKVFIALLALLAMATFLPANATHDACCAGDCKKCATVCEETLKYFLSKGGKYAESQRVQLIKDCIAICKTSEDFKSRHSPYASRVSKLCNDICAKCADSCEALNDANLKDCVAMCRKCSTSAPCAK